MARAPEIPPGALESIARQIGNRLSPPGMTALAKGAPVEIGESFPVYMLGLDALRAKAKDLKAAVQQTGVWQHQIRYGSQAREFARSTAPGSGADDWRVQEVVKSPLAEHIDRAIAWIDKNGPDDAVAYLLLIPAFYLTAFWLQEPKGDEIVIAEMPPKLGTLEPLRLYPAGEFLKELSALKPLAGVPEFRRQAR